MNESEIAVSNENETSVALTVLMLHVTTEPRA